MVVIDDKSSPENDGGFTSAVTTGLGIDSIPVMDLFAMVRDVCEGGTAAISSVGMCVCGGGGVSAAVSIGGLGGMLRCCGITFEEGLAGVFPGSRGDSSATRGESRAMRGESSAMRGESSAMRGESKTRRCDGCSAVLSATASGLREERGDTDDEVEEEEEDKG